MAGGRLILISNDDGYHAPGIRALKESLQGLGRLVVCCPDREQSAASHALTLSRPLRLNRMAEDEFSVDGTPTDSVLLGIHVALKGKKPDLVISGINSGPNMADDISYSGTVAAALEGALFGIPSIAVSLTSHNPKDFSGAQKVARELAEWVFANGLPPETLLNVNVPAIEPAKIRGRRITSQGKRHFEEIVSEKEDPRGVKYYWVAGTRVIPEQDPASDLLAVEQGYVSITPLRFELTAEDLLGKLKGLEQG